MPKVNNSTAPQVPPTPIGEWLKPVLFGVAAMAFAGLATFVVKGRPLVGLALYVCAGVFLLFARPKGAPAMGMVPRERHALEAWEPWFVLALAVAAFATRLWALDRYPMGATGAEGEIATGMLQHMQGIWSYTPYERNCDINWGTLPSYQGAAFAKWLGWKAGNFRIASGLWGGLSVMVFYFAARQIASAGPAAIASLLLVGSMLHLAISRQYFPGSILFFAPLAAFGFSLQGLRSRRLGLFAAAGFCLSLTLHGYTAGRPVFTIFAAWFAWLHLVDKEKAPGLKPMLVFWGFFLLGALPVLVWAARFPEQYMGVVNHVNPNKGRGLMGYLAALREVAPPYLKMWQVAGDFSHTEGPQFRPILDLFTGALFSSGVFLLLALFWRPVPAFLLAFLAATLAPAMFGGGFAHPTTRRALMAAPASCLIAAFTLERLRQALNPLRRRGVGIVLGVVGILAGAGVAAYGVRVYFVDYLSDKEHLAKYDYAIWLAGKEMKDHPAAEVVMSQTLGASVVTGILFEQGRDVRRPLHDDELLVLNPQRDTLMQLDPFYRHMMPALREAYPNLKAEFHAMPQGLATMRSDPADGTGYFQSVLVPASDARGLRGLVDSASGSRVAAFAPEFGVAMAGRRLHLCGLLVNGQATRDTVFVMGWPGWTLKVNGRSIPWGKSIALDQGLQRLEIEGQAPQTASGPLPLAVRWAGRDFAAEGRVLALRALRGFREVDSKPGRPDLVARTFGNVRRFYDPTDMNVPFTARFKTTLRVPDAGPYAFNLAGEKDGAIRVAGRVVFSRERVVVKDGREKHVVVQNKVALKAGVPVAFEVEFRVPDDGSRERYCVVEAQGPAGGDFAVIPTDWLSLEE